MTFVQSWRCHGVGELDEGRNTCGAAGDETASSPREAWDLASHAADNHLLDHHDGRGAIDFAPTRELTDDPIDSAGLTARDYLTGAAGAALYLLLMLGAWALEVTLR